MVTSYICVKRSIFQKSGHNNQVANLGMYSGYTLKVNWEVKEKNFLIRKFIDSNYACHRNFCCSMFGLANNKLNILQLVFTAWKKHHKTSSWALRLQSHCVQVHIWLGQLFNCFPCVTLHYQCLDVNLQLFAILKWNRLPLHGFQKRNQPESLIITEVIVRSAPISLGFC